MEVQDVVVEAPEVKEVAPSTTPESVSAEVSTAPVSDPAAVTPEGAAGVLDDAAKAVAAQYNPNFKYSVHGKEFEFDEWARPFLTKKEIEDKVRDLYTRAHGIDEIKKERDSFRETGMKFEGELSKTNAGLEILREHVKNEDFDAFFKATNIPMEKVWNWVRAKVKYQELSPEQKRQYDENIELRRSQSQLSRENTGFEGQLRQLRDNQRKMELEIAMNQQGIADLEKEFDARAGQPGAFRNSVAIEAQRVWESSGGKVDLSAQDAVSQYAEYARKLLGISNTASAQSNPKAAEPKPVIPNIKGRGTSPVVKKPKTLAELREQINKDRSSLASR